ncbi:hypothetical protein BH09ACT13_BH09ACT13_16810 [soil metagenome]
MDGIRRCDEILRDAGDDLGVEAHTLYSLAVLESLRGHFDEARELAERGLSVFEKTGMVFTVWYALHLGSIELLAANPEDAEQALRRACEDLEAAVDLPSLTNAASLLAEVRVDQGMLDEADELSARARDWAPKDQPPQHARWRAARARVLVRRGAPEAVALAEEAVALAGKTDFPVLQGDCYLALADVRMIAGVPDARRAVQQALGCYTQKGSTVLAARARALFEATSSTP